MSGARQDSAGRLWAGTSGWTYPHWRGLFYPESLPSRDYLGYYSSRFETTEINYSFYHLPKAETFRKWSAATPAGFRFAVKVNRAITHNQRLRQADEIWRKFIQSALELGPKLGPLLLQFPPSFRSDAGLLGEFLNRSREAAPGKEIMLAFEFRHASWFSEPVAEMLRSAGAAMVIADSSRYPMAPPAPTASFVYLRFHGPEALFASSYSDQQLRVWAERIRGWLDGGLDVYAYFNNDAGGCAIRNLRRLLEFTGRPAGEPSSQD